MNDEADFDKRFWFSPEVCEKQLYEADRITIFLEQLLRENCSDDYAWESKLNQVLCDYYCHVNNFKALMNEILDQETHLNEKTEKEEFLLSREEVELMRAQAQIILLDDNTLFMEHGFSLTVH